MSTSPEISTRTDDRLVTAISRWLARHGDDAELRQEVAAAPRGELGPGQTEALEELAEALDRDTARADTEMVARETLEALALGG
jgi:hypothetical protein